MNARPHPPAPVATHVVQSEWNNTLARLRALHPLSHVAEEVRPTRHAFFATPLLAADELLAVERILFDNLLLAPLHRSVRNGQHLFACEWLWQWRKAVPWKADPISSVIRLYPDSPLAMSVYRFNVLEAE